MPDLVLLPRPRSVEQRAGQHQLRPGRRIAITGADPAAPLLGSAHRLQAALAQREVRWEITAADPGPDDEIGARLRLVDAGLPDQGYRLRIAPDQLSVEAGTPAGIFYGVCTLIQVLDQTADALPCLEIEDHPDFAVRGVMLDVSRDKVPTQATLYELVDMLAAWKINQLQLYTEHTFAYRAHPEVWADASPLTGEEILDLDRYCRERFVELVPNQNSFGHMHRWLIHDRYAALAETHDRFNTPWNVTMQGPFSLCPGDPGSIALVRTLYDELLPHFTSRMFNAGCDETVDVGQGRSRAAVAERGEGRVYLDYLLEVYAAVRERGRTLQFWGDIIVQHPDLIRELPKDVIALEWGYEAEHPFAENCPRFGASGLEFYVCPGTSAWCSLAGRTDNALQNLASAAQHGLEHGARGYLITDWGDRGHWQMQPVSFPGFAAGAAYAWAWDANRDLDIRRATAVHAFHDRAELMGTVAADLGDVYRTPGLARPNGSQLFWVLQLSFDEIAQHTMPPAAAFEQALGAIDAAIAPLEEARIERPDAALIAGEYSWTARLMRHACRRGLLALGGDDRPDTRAELDADMAELIEDYRRLWLARNRPGGLADSVARFQRARMDYQR